MAKQKAGVRRASGPDLVAAAATLGVIGAGAALLESVLLPAVVIGGAAVLAPRYFRKLRWRDGKRPQALAAPAPQPAATRDDGALVGLGGFKIRQALAKTITYRIIITATDFSWNYYVLGEAAAAAGLSGVSLAAGPIFYFVHETAWNRLGAAAMREAGLWRPAAGPSAAAPDAGAPLVVRGKFAVDRALAKTITFRLFATVTEFTTNYAVVRDVATATALTAFGFVAGPFIYLGHEKAWEHLAAPKASRKLAAQERA